ncbi:sigma-70, region 4, partial [Fusobacterium equinum]
EERKIRIDFEYQDFNSEDEKTTEEENSICLKTTLEQYIKLACDEKEALILKKIYFESYQQQEIAKEMGVCRQRVNAIVKRSLQKLRRVFYENHYHTGRKR